MRTKALLCAAAVAAGALSAKAQSNVYSLNIVGYVNVTFAPGNLTYVNPLDLDGTNSADNTLKLPDGTIFAFWTGSAFDYWYFDTTLGLGSPDGWYASDQATPRTAPLLTPGKGFYLAPPFQFTNTWVGNVKPGPGTTNTLVVPPGNQLVGSVLPVGGYVTNAAMNLHLFDGTITAIWTGSAFSYRYFDTTLGLGAPDGWYAADQATPADPPQLQIGRSFYIASPATLNWQQSLQ